MSCSRENVVSDVRDWCIKIACLMWQLRGVLFLV